MNTKEIKSANKSLPGYYGGEKMYKGNLGILYSEGIRQIAINTQSYWFIDVIQSYQSKLKNQEFQVWKLLRDFKTNTNGEQIAKNSFTVICEDGNDKQLIKQIIPFSDFIYDEYTVWNVNNTIILPIEY